MLAARLGKLRSLAIDLDVQAASVLLSAAGLAQLHTLELRTRGLDCWEDGAQIAALLLQAESLGQLTSLTINSRDVGDKLLDLFRAPQLQQLKYLNVPFGKLSPAVAHQLVTMPWPAALSLDKIHHLPLRDEDEALLAQHPNVANVTCMYGCSPTLLTSPHLGSLQTFSSSNWQSTYALVQNRTISALRDLSLHDRAVHIEEVRYLAQATHLTSLRSLEISRAGLTIEHLRVLLSAPWFAQLETLDFHDNALGDECIALLCTMLPPNLRKLELGENNITATGLAALLQHPVSAHLEAFGINSNPLGHEGIKLLTQHPVIATMYGRDTRGGTYHGMFTYIGIGDAELAMILDSPHLKPLPRLDLCYNSAITDAGFAMLAQHPILSTVRDLRMSCEDEALINLLSSPNASRLHNFSTRYYPDIHPDTWRIASEFTHLTPTLRALLDDNFKQSSLLRR